jgi:hypothetical protein
MRTIFTRVVFLAATAAVGGCSGSAATPTDRSSVSTLGALSVGSRGDLPACNASTEATVAYVVDEKKIVACVSGAWTPVVFGSGPPGADGAAGASGAQGPDGAQGPSGAQGNRGATGESGPAGAHGGQGPQGDQGDPGATGAPGVGLASLVAVTAVPPNDPHCVFGGIQIAFGVDDDGNGVLADAEVDQTAYVCNPSAPVRVRTAFVTSQAWSGALGGVAGADQKCQETADAVSSFSGKTWKAWISAVGSTPVDRFTKDGKFVRTDGVQIAGSFDRLLDPYYTQLDAPLRIDENGAPVAAGAEVWTSTQYDGSAYGSSYECGGWTDGTAGSNGLTGAAAASSSAWEAANTRGCDVPQHLYCFEQ